MFHFVFYVCGFDKEQQKGLNLFIVQGMTSKFHMLLSMQKDINIKHKK
jgi:hypothetical protein